MKVATRSLDLAAQQRAGLVTWYLMCGYGLSTMDVAELTGLTRTGAWLMMNKLEAVLPLTVVGGRWRMRSFSQSDMPCPETVNADVIG